MYTNEQHRCLRVSVSSTRTACSPKQNQLKYSIMIALYTQSEVPDLLMPSTFRLFEMRFLSMLLLQL